jgi:hypothetical protein
VGPAERAADEGLQACDFIEGGKVAVDLGFTSVFSDCEVSAPLDCEVFENDKTADFGVIEVLDAPELTDLDAEGPGELELEDALDGAAVDTWVLVFPVSFFPLPNQSLNSLASSPSNVAVLALALSCKISSMVRVSRLWTLSLVKVFGSAARRALTDCELLQLSEVGADVASIAPPGSRLPALL